jgi:hypothetical protein
MIVSKSKMTFGLDYVWSEICQIKNMQFKLSLLADENFRVAELLSWLAG